MSLENALRAFCSQWKEDKTYWLAYSGGLDSQVLLSVCAKLGINLRAIHINHSVSPNAKVWAEHCKFSCENYAIKYIERTIQLDLNAGDSFEEVARKQRYAIFAEYMQAGDVLFTAHHQDDQAETLLLQLVRGAGPKGLAAMPAIKSFAKGYHARPLLEFPRAELLEYANSQQLTWVEDESNQDCSLSRNFIRHEVLSKLKTRWPSVTASISRSAAHCAENQILTEEFAKEIYLQVEGTRKNTLSVAKLLQLPVEKQRLVLRVWMQELNYSLPDTKKMESILRDVLTASWDSMPLVQWGDVALRRHKDNLYLTKVFEVNDERQNIEWEVEQTLILPRSGILKTRQVQGSGLRADITNVSVRYRRGSEMAAVRGRGRQSLKNLFQEWEVLPWERDLIPLVYVEDRLIAVAGYFLDEEFAARGSELGREIIFG